ncbi:MAG: QueT transporter family protein [Firmicutes bacterium]|nr:QueT transporter family protein [Bacillota bacterium]
MKNKTLNLTWAALIAALYVVLTLIANALGLASGAIQIRLSEALTIMPLFTWAAVPGLTIGCILANLLTGCALWDIVFGSIATFLGALGTYYIGRKIPVLGPVFPIASNMLIVPLVLQKVYGIEDGYLYLLVTVGIGEVICCGVLGWMLYKALKKRNINWM